VLAMLTLFFGVHYSRNEGLTSQAYNRVITCIISVEPNRRTQDYVKLCYETAERATGKDIEHFGDGR
jgi:hypothetical protein